MKNLVMLILMSEPVQRVLKEVVLMLTEETISSLRLITNNFISQNLEKRIENKGEKNVQLHSQSLSNTESQKQNSCLRLVTD